MTRLRWNCETQGCRLKERWDPALLDGCLPRGSSFGDNDAWAEIGGRFLFIEHKGQGVDLVGGQRMALVRLAALEPVTVLFIRDRADGDYDIRNMSYPDQAYVKTLNGLREYVKEWGLRSGP